MLHTNSFFHIKLVCLSSFRTKYRFCFVHPIGGFFSYSFNEKYDFKKDDGRRKMQIKTYQKESLRKVGAKNCMLCYLFA